MTGVLQICNTPVHCSGLIYCRQESIIVLKKRRKVGKTMWTKRYLTKPTEEEYFKTKHPIATSSMIAPLIVYYLVCLIKGINSPWMLMGIVGCLVFGIGLGYAFAIRLKIYKKPLLPIVCLLSGGILVVMSLLFC